MIEPDHSGSLAVGAPADLTAYPTLTPDQLDRLSDFGDVHEAGAGEPLFLEDVRSQSMKRVAAAVGDGSSAIRSVHQRLAPATP
jgi:hypothetical protein